ncbi:MAG: ABC transporter substrate-binding protein [Pseudomonadota bacterium]
MADNSVAVPLVELNSSIVASRGRFDQSGTPFFRSVVDLFPEFLASQNLTFIGTQSATDYEALIAVQPDLIIGRTWDESEVDQLSAIAPVILLDDTGDAFDYYRKIADASGRLAVFERLAATYEEAVEKQRILIGDHNYTFQNTQFAGASTISVCGRFGALGQALDDLNFTITGLSAEVDARGISFCDDVSPEIITSLEADFIFDTYRTDVFPDGPLDALERINGTVTGACQQLTACIEGRMIFVPREYAFPVSFRSLTIMLHFVASHVAGRPKVELSR